MAVSGRQTTLTGGYVGGDWKSALIQVGISMAETIITNYVRDKALEASNKASNIWEGRNKTFVHPRRQYRSRRRKFLRPRYIQNWGRKKTYRRRYSNRSRF